MPKIGLKLWSTNLSYIPAAMDLFAKKTFDYIELFTVPGSLSTIPKWKGTVIPYVLHAPHSMAGFNPADPACRKTNLNIIKQVDEFFCALSPMFVIFHPGLNGSEAEAVSQFRSFGKAYPSMYKKTIIENKPQVGLQDERCLGASPEEMRSLLRGTGCGFCLDFVHAICYSVFVGEPWKNALVRFLAMDPSVYHLCDGSYSVKDTHKPLGEGELDLPYLISLIGPKKYVTLETKKAYTDSLDDFIQDVKKLKEYARA
ncbi:MAG: TIM barrel protein [Candidatus Omnitrophica bacterium]|nr:TIM barrel protein [Candidatus Omnitrophota bacterium]